MHTAGWAPVPAAAPASEAAAAATAHGQLDTAECNVDSWPGLFDMDLWNLSGEFHFQEVSTMQAPCALIPLKWQCRQHVRRHKPPAALRLWVARLFLLLPLLYRVSVFGRWQQRVSPAAGHAGRPCQPTRIRAACRPGCKQRRALLAGTVPSALEGGAQRLRRGLGGHGRCIRAGGAAPAHRQQPGSGGSGAAQHSCS